MEELAGLGVSVYTCARSQETLQTSLESWRQAGLQVQGSVCDLSVRQAREELFGRVRAHFGDSLDILVRSYMAMFLSAPGHSCATVHGLEILVPERTELVAWVQVNNVGSNIRKPTLDYTGDDFSFVMSTNFESAYHCSQLGHPLLKASGRGTIVFISSVAGVTAIRSGTLYAATKGIFTAFVWTGLQFL